MCAACLAAGGPSCAVMKCCVLGLYSEIYTTWRTFMLSGGNQKLHHCQHLSRGEFNIYRWRSTVGFILWLLKCLLNKILIMTAIFWLEWMRAKQTDLISTWPHLKCDVGLVEGEYSQNCLRATVLCTGIMVHNLTGSFYRSLDWILLSLALYLPSDSVSLFFMLLHTLCSENNTHLYFVA